MQKFLKICAVVLALPVVLVGCKISSINYFPPHPANVRVANVIPDVTAINVDVGGTPAWSGLPFQSLTPYQSYNNTTTVFTVTAVGGTSPLIQATYPLAGEQSYTLVTFGIADAPGVLMMQDTSVSPGNGKFQVIVANAAIGLNTGAVDVYFTAPGTSLDDVTPTFFDVVYGGTGVVGTFSSGTYSMRVTPTGTKTLIYDSGPRTFGDNTETDVIIYTKGSAHLVNVAMLDINSGGQSVIANNIISDVKVVNAAPQTGSIDMLLDGVPSLSTVGYLAASPYAGVLAGARTVTFEATATPGAVIASLAQTLLPATDQSIFLMGFSGALKAVPLVDNNLPPLSGNVRLRFVNASPDAPPLDMLINATKPFTGVASATASGYVQLPAGTVTLSFADSATGTVVLTLPNVVLTAGQTSTVYVMGPVAGLGGLVTPDT